MTPYFRGAVAGAAVLASAWMGRPAVAADDVTLFVVPARYSVLQVMFDVNRRHPVGLMSYQGDSQTVRPVLHAWDGQEWQPVSLDDFRSGTFARNKPGRVVLVGEPSQLPPVLAEGASAWCTVVMNLTDLGNADLLNACGKILGFSNADYNWFAARYNMDMKDGNADRRKDSWYYHPYVERPKAPKTTLAPAEVAPPAAAAPEAEVIRAERVVAPAPAAKPAPAPADKPAIRTTPPAAEPAPEPAPAFAPNAMWEKPDKEMRSINPDIGVK